jgi:choline kinase
MEKTVYKSVIITGGKGSRIPELTSGVIPKSLCFVKKKPLLAYHITLLKKAGITEFLVVFEKDWQEALFKNFVQNNFFPKACYTTCVIDWEKKNPFRCTSVKNYITKSSFVFSHGDIHISLSSFKKLLLQQGEIKCFFDETMNIVPLFFDTNGVERLLNEKNLNIQKFLKNFAFKYKKPKEYININTLQDLDSFKKIIDK